MRAAEFGISALLFLALLALSKAEVYIATIEGEPIISYKGDIDGFEATAVESDEKIDTTRYSQSLASHLCMYGIYLCACICMYACMYVCTYVGTTVCMYKICVSTHMHTLLSINGS